MKKDEEKKKRKKHWEIFIHNPDDSLATTSLANLISRLFWPPSGESLLLTKDVCFYFPSCSITIVLTSPVGCFRDEKIKMQRWQKRN